MNVFRRWVSSGIFQTHWPAVRGEFSEGFIRFCESELNLRVQEPKFAWLDGYLNMDGQPITREEFRKGLKELDREFLVEWPHVVLPEISEGRSGLAEMFDHACKHPPKRRGRPMAVLIVRGETAHEGRPASDDSPAGENPREVRPTREPNHYGVILAWRSSDGVIELVVWLRGAYGTLAIGEAIEKTIRDFKKELEGPNANEGYTLRTRYPSDDRSRGKQRWRRALWTDFFQNQGFHRDDSDTAVNAPDTLDLPLRSALDRFAAASSGMASNGCSEGGINDERGRISCSKPGTSTGIGPTSSGATGMRGPVGRS